MLGLRRGVIRRNLERSFPALDAAARRQIAREFVGRQSQVFAEIDYARRDPGHGTARARAAARPARRAGAGARRAPRRLDVFLGGHQCNFEWLLLRLSLELGAGLVALYKPLRDAARRALFPLAPHALRRAAAAGQGGHARTGTVRSARALGMIADQVPRTSPERHWTTFLHQPTAFFKGPERLARALRGRIVYVSMRRLGRGRYEIELEPLTPVGRTAAERRGHRTLRARARARHRWPTRPGWWWSHKRWKLKPPEEVTSD